MLGKYFHYNGLGQRMAKIITGTQTSQVNLAGDANNDGLITAADSTAIIDQILGISTAPGKADCNQDILTNVQDLVCLNNLINGANGTSSTIQYRYSLNGQLLGEYDDANAPISEYVYLNGQVLAVLSNNQVYYVHSDHLGTPQKLTDTSGSVVWSASYDPFGKATVNEDVDGDNQKLVFNVRFPGQYYDAETGLHYNYFRYYDPSTGRYITSDPIGLRGGLNTYGYVGGNPVKYSDPLGLVEWSGKYSGGSLVVGGVYRYTLTSDCINGRRATVKVTAIGGGPSIDAAISAIGGNVTFNDNLDVIDPSVFNGEFISGGISYSLPPNATTMTGMLLGGADPSTVANMNHGGSCGVTGLGGAKNESCGGIRGLSIGIGALYGGSFVTDVKWGKCGGGCE